MLILIIKNDVRTVLALTITIKKDNIEKMRKEGEML